MCCPKSPIFKFWGNTVDCFSICNKSLLTLLLLHGIQLVECLTLQVKASSEDILLTLRLI